MEKQESLELLGIYLVGDKLEVRSIYPTLVQVGLLVDAANQLLSRLLLTAEPEGVKKLDNQKVLDK